MRMSRKLWVLVLAVCLISLPAYALLDDNSTNQEQVANGGSASQDQGQGQGQDQGQGQNQGQAQGQGQGQAQAAVAIQGQNQGQGNEQVTNISDKDEVNSYVMAAPNTVAHDGQSAMSAYSVFGGLNIAESDEYMLAIEIIRTLSQMQAAGLITKDEARAEALEALDQLKESTRPKRVLGFLWKTRGRHAGNLLGLISMDDGYVAIQEVIDLF